MIADPADTVESRQAAAASLRTFMRLPVAQRSSVILMDVLGCSLQEICAVMDFSLPAAKAALHRGRTRLSELAGEPDDAPPPVLSEADRARLGAYVDRFNARDFDAIRDMIADDVRLDLVNKTRMNGKAEVTQVFWKLFESARLASGARTGRGTAGDPGIRSRQAVRQTSVFHAAAMVRPTRSRPSAISAMRPMSRMTLSFWSRRRDVTPAIRATDPAPGR